LILSRPTTYAVRALIYLAKQDTTSPVLAPAIAEAERLPAPFLAKLLRKLSEARILSSSRGPGGGYKLAKSPDDITLQEIADLFEGISLAHECLLGYGVCSDETPCPVHKLWGPRKGYMRDFLAHTTIGELLRLESGRVAKALGATRRGRRPKSE